MHRWKLGCRARAAGEEGFTLVELLVVLAVLGLALAFVIPNIQRARVKSGTSLALRTLEGVLINARSEALRRHSPVVVAFNTTTRAFTVFEDWDPNNAAVSGNGNGTLDGAEETIATTRLDNNLKFAVPPGGGSVIVPTGATSLEYASDGTLQAPSGGLTVHIADSKGNYFRIRVNDVTGAGRLEKWLSGTSWSPRRETWVWSY